MASLHLLMCTHYQIKLFQQNKQESSTTNASSQQQSQKQNRLFQLQIIKMMWRHLFQEHISSASFVEEQLAFERQIYKNMVLCQKDDIVATHAYSRCAQKWQKRIQKYGLMLQYLVSDREKMLQSQLQECKGKQILPCVNKKQRDFIQKYYKQDLQFLNILEENSLTNKYLTPTFRTLKRLQFDMIIQAKINSLIQIKY